jgi:maleylacetate reductase
LIAVNARAWAFTYEAQAQRVIFGPGRRAVVGDEVDRLGATRAVLISGATPEIGDELTAVLGARLAGRWDEFIQHVPVELAERARAFVDERAADVIVTVGGGSATGLAKAIALTHRLPIVAVPTTYAGSEQTPIYGLTGDHNKQTGSDPVVKPVSVVYDTELTLVLPPEVTGPSAFNALAHSVEGMYAAGHNPVTTALALEGIRAIARSLPVVMGRPDDLAARGELLFGAYLSGVVLGATSAGLHHKLAHVLGGTYDLVHADAHSVLLPHVVAFNAPALPDEFGRLADALGAADGAAPTALWELASASNVPTALADLKSQHEGLALSRDDLGAVAARVAAEAPANPRPVDAASLLTLLDAAFDGRRPAAIGGRP